MDRAADLKVSQLADGTVVVALAGDICLTTVTSIRTGLVDAAARVPSPHRLVVDLHHVTFLDSSGLSALVAGFKAAGEAGVAFTVRDANPVIVGEFVMTGLLDLFNYVDADGRSETPRPRQATVEPA